ncbi:hypothetical protein N658DRAFT_168633 [Parathielavia hyrcaniae]|uniref:Uncharacterized protein n=1 Tax=Parathielavia hyrcaniae TaxID=113614 RepID=A0AAN6PWZ2_9PEZI|nr:hypothetical protein N658DRAFT_168633 [Parathielavia hyrcaniae]
MGYEGTAANDGYAAGFFPSMYPTHLWSPYLATALAQPNAFHHGLLPPFSLPSPDFAQAALYHPEQNLTGLVSQPSITGAFDSFLPGPAIQFGDFSPLSADSDSIFAAPQPPPDIRYGISTPEVSADTAVDLGPFSSADGMFDHLEEPSTSGQWDSSIGERLTPQSPGSSAKNISCPATPSRGSSNRTIWTASSSGSSNRPSSTSSADGPYPCPLCRGKHIEPPPKSSHSTTSGGIASGLNAGRGADRDSAIPPSEDDTRTVGSTAAKGGFNMQRAPSGFFGGITCDDTKRGSIARLDSARRHCLLGSGQRASVAGE